MVQVPGASDAGIGQVRNDIGRPAYQTANATPDVFGAQVGRDFQQLGRGLNETTDALKRVQDVQEKAQSYEAYTKLSDGAREYLNNPETGLYTKKGSQVFGASKTATKDLDDLYAKASQGLGGGAQLKLRALWDAKKENLLDNVSRYEVKELNDYKEQAELATLKTSVDDAIENYNNPIFIADSIAIGEATIDDSMAGSAPVVIEAKKELFRSQLHSGVVNRMAIDNPLGAEQYYKKHKDQISGTEQVSIEKTLDVGTTRAASQTATEQIISKNATLDEQLKEARQIANPKIQDDVVNRIKTRYAEQQTILEEQAKETKSEAWKIIVDQKSIDAIPVQQWAALDGATQKTMTDYVNRKNDPQTDIKKWKELSDIYAASPEEFSKIDMLDYVNVLSNADFKDFSAKQQKIIGGDNVDSIKVRTYNQIANDRLESIGIKTTASGSSSDKQKTAGFMRSLTDQIASHTKLNGKEPNNQQVEEIIDKMLIRGEASEKDLGTGSSGTDAAYSFELPEGATQPLVVDDLSNVPPSVRRKAQKALEQIGAKATEENILKLVNEKLKNERK